MINTESFIIRTESTHPDNVTNSLMFFFVSELQEQERSGDGHFAESRERSKTSALEDKDLKRRDENFTEKKARRASIFQLVFLNRELYACNLAFRLQKSKVPEFWGLVTVFGSFVRKECIFDLVPINNKQ